MGIPTKVLSHVLVYIEWQQLLLIVSRVCSEWRQVCGSNAIWRTQLSMLLIPTSSSFPSSLHLFPSSISVPSQSLLKREKDDFTNIITKGGTGTCLQSTAQVCTHPSISRTRSPCLNLLSLFYLLILSCRIRETLSNQATRRSQDFASAS